MKIEVKNIKQLDKLIRPLVVKDFYIVRDFNSNIKIIYSRKDLIVAYEYTGYMRGIDQKSIEMFAKFINME